MGPWELLIIFLVVLVLFGAKRLPEIASGLGKGIKEFKKAVKDTGDELKGSLSGESQGPQQPKSVKKPDDEEEKPDGQ